MRLLLPSLALFCATASTSAQVTSPRAVVLSQVSGRAQLYEVDLATAKLTPLARFPGDTDRPLRIDRDPASGDLFVALAKGKSTTQFVRLSYSGTALVRSHDLGGITGICASLVVSDRGALFAGVEGPDGIVRTERLGTKPAMLASARSPVAMSGYGTIIPYAWVVESARGSLPTQVRQLRFPLGNTQQGPYSWPKLTTRITGMVELPTGAIRFLLTDDQGRLLVSTGLGEPQAITMTPALPAGGTVALRSFGGLTVYSVGSQAHPYLESSTGYGSTGSWTRVAGPIPGSPVDFVLVSPPAPEVVPMGHGCQKGARTAFELTGSGAPRLGSANFALRGANSGHPNAPGLLAFGARELALPLPGGCSLQTRLDIVLVQLSDANGHFTQPLPIPSDTRLSGLSLPMQWLVPVLSQGFRVDVSGGAWPDAHHALSSSHSAATRS